MKRIGLLKIAHRVQGKILEAPSGVRFIVIEQKGRDVWRGGYKSIEEAIENDAAAIGVDRVLLERCAEHKVHTVMVVIEEQRRLFLAPVSDLMDNEKSRSRTSHTGRTARVMDYRLWHNKYLGPAKTVKERSSSHLRSNAKRSNA
jgi:hypothetical protein